MRFLGTAAALAAVAAGAGCATDFTRQGRSPSQITIVNLEAASGAQPGLFGGTLDSDVITLVSRTVAGEQVQVPTIFDDIARVTMRLVLKDQGVPGVPATPSPLNEITITRYRVVFRRTDGRNTAGVDVPFPFESATTFTIPADSNATQSFELVRHVAKQEAPLAALANNATIISTIADITFFGRDMAGHDVSVSGSIGIHFGNFGDPT
jgi:hypothetical protein